MAYRLYYLAHVVDDAPMHDEIHLHDVVLMHYYITHTIMACYSNKTLLAKYMASICIMVKNNNLFVYQFLCVSKCIFLR